MEINNSSSDIKLSQSRGNSFHSIFRNQQLQLKRLEQELISLRQHNQGLTVENTQLKLNLTTQRQLIETNESKQQQQQQQRYSSAPFQSGVQFAPGIVSYEKHIQALQRDKQCMSVELGLLRRDLSQMTDSVATLEQQIDKIHREYRTKLVVMTQQLYPTLENIKREMRDSYGQQLTDLRERNKSYRAQAFKLKNEEKELRLRQVLLEHSSHGCLFNQSCIETCLSVVRHIENCVDNKSDDVSLVRACELLRRTIAKLLPRLFQTYSSEKISAREYHQSELMEQYDHLIGEIRSYKPW